VVRLLVGEGPCDDCGGFRPDLNRCPRCELEQRAADTITRLLDERDAVVKVKDSELESLRGQVSEMLRHSKHSMGTAEIQCRKINDQVARIVVLERNLQQSREELHKYMERCIDWRKVVNEAEKAAGIVPGSKDPDKSVLVNRCNRLMAECKELNTQFSAVLRVAKKPVGYNYGLAAWIASLVVKAEQADVLRSADASAPPPPASAEIGARAGVEEFRRLRDAAEPVRISIDGPYTFQGCPEAKLEIENTDTPELSVAEQALRWYSRCPTCDSPEPKLHPAVQHEGEVQECRDPWHSRPRGVVSQ
jgi:hypothetical protein